MCVKLLDAYLVMHVLQMSCSFKVVGYMEYEYFALEQWYENKCTDKDISESGMNHPNIISSSDVLNNIGWNEFAHYDETLGKLELRKLLALIYKCNEEAILITNGASEAVFIVLESLQ